MTAHQWHALKSLSLMTALIVATVTAANAAEIQVPLDHVQTVTLGKPAKTIYIGNPAIADVTVIDPRHIFLLGKTFGSTNLIALDASGQETLNEQVVVTERPGTAVTVQRGIARTTMICTSAQCQAAPAPGDDATSDKKQVLGTPSHDALMDQADRREAAGQRAAGSK